MNQIDASELLNKMKMLANLAQSQPPSEANENTASFQDLLSKAVGGVNHLSENASNLINRFEAHDPNVSITEAMIALQKANLSFQAMTQVRNQLVNAYQDIMNMPI